MLRWKFIALNAYIRKEDLKSIISFHFKKLEKEKQIKSKVSKVRKIQLKNKAESMKNKKSKEKINKTKN